VEVRQIRYQEQPHQWSQDSLKPYHEALPPRFQNVGSPEVLKWLNPTYVQRLLKSRCEAYFLSVYMLTILQLYRLYKMKRS